MNEFVTVFWTQIWQVTAVAVVVFVAVKAFAKNRPHLAHVLWALVLIKCITPPIFSSHISPFSWLAAEVNTVHVESSTTGDFIDEIQLDTESDNLVSVKAPGFRLSGKRGDALANSIREAAPIPAFNKAPIVNWKCVLVVVWLVGATVCLLWQGGRLLSLSILVRRKRQQASPEIKSLVAELSSRLGLKRNVRPLITAAPIGPAVVGLFCPMILLPMAIVDRRPVSELEPLIAHELIHVRRGDLWWALLQSVAGSLFWFHPLVRLAVVGISRESERSCDEETVTSLGCDPADYARCLINVLEQKHRLRSAPALPGVKPIEITSARLERVMKLGHGSHKRTPWWTWGVLIGCCAIVLPGAALVFAQEADEKTEPIGFLKESPHATPERLTDETLVGLVYNVADILEEMEKKQPDAMVQELELRLIRQLKHRSSLGKSGTLQRVTKIRDGKLTAMRTVAEHEKLKEQVSRIRKFGLRQIVIETRIIKCPAGAFDDLDWEEAAGGSFVGRRGHIKRKKAINEKVVSASYEPVEAVGMGRDAQVVDAGTLISSVPDSEVHELISDEQTNQAVFQAIISENETEDLLSRVQVRGDAHVIQSPTVTMFDGQNAKIQDYAQRPFVTGVDVLKNAKGHVANQPRISIVGDGTCLDLKAESAGDSEVSLEVEILFSALKAVNTFTFNQEDGEPLTVQLPVVSASRMRFDGTVAENQSLLVRTTNPDDHKEDVLFVITPRLIDDLESATVDGKEGAALPPSYSVNNQRALLGPKEMKRRFEKLCFENNVSASEKDVDQRIESLAGGLGMSTKRWINLVADAKKLSATEVRAIVANNVKFLKLPKDAQRKSQEGRLAIRLDANIDGIVIRAKDDNRNWGVDKAKVIEVGGGKIVIRTDAEMSATQDGIEFKGNDLEVVSTNGEPYASADELQLMMSGENVRISLKGNAQLTVGATISADAINFDSQSTELLALGRGSVTVEGVQLSADRIEQQEERLILKGNAKVEINSSKPQKFMGETIELGGESGKVIVDGQDAGEFEF